MRATHARVRVRRLSVVTVLTCALFVGAGGSDVSGSSTGKHKRRAHPEILFGLGPEADGAGTSALVKAAPVRMLSSWFNGTSDLTWISRWKSDEIPRAYAAGYALHLIQWASNAQTTKISTRYGTACGRAYPLSSQFLRDMTQLAEIFRGPPKSRLYVTLFAEFQTYACSEDAWSADPQSTAYFMALKDQYRAALKIFHTLAPNSAVSLGWGGWQTEWNAPATGGGRSLFAHFADVLKESDFESFEVINTSREASDLVGMTSELGRFGPVMLAYDRPDGEATPVATADLKAFLSQAFLSRLTRSRLFAVSFMDARFLATNPASFAVVRDAVKRFHCRSCRLPG